MSRINNSYYAIIGILGIEPMSGYNIKNWVDQGVGYFWDVDYKQIYPTLKKIVEEGLATYEVMKSGNRPDSKVYMLTEKGRKELIDWLNKPVQSGKFSMNELMLKIFFGHNVPVEVNLRHLENYKQSCLDAIEDLKNLMKKFEDDPKKNDSWHYRMTTAMKGTLNLNTEIEWCNRSMEYIKANIKTD
jgi:DNA-binding PadR family transcriptional regulator